MNQAKYFLAVDLGAESGRTVIGRFDGDQLTLRETHRFGNGPTQVQNRLYWNVLGLFAGIKEGIAKSNAEAGGELCSLGLDTWGVDYGLLDRKGELIGNPRNYRDSRTDGMLEQAFALVPREEIFAQTGLQFMQINTLFQLLAMKLEESPALASASQFLMMPDLLNYWLTGQQVCEYTIASTSQCYDSRKGDWASPLLERLGLPTTIFPPVVQPGSKLGSLLPEVAAELSIGSSMEVIAPGCHDTASAVAAVPMQKGEEQHSAYISSGTWSLVGVETSEPVINEKSLAYNFTNEGGVENTIRLLKNVTGLWLIQECRRIWAQRGEELSYGEITRLASEANPFGACVDPDDSAFLAPGDMPARIQEYCQRTGQTPPADKGSLARCAMESLAFKYRWVIERLEELIERPIQSIHIVGGGTQNQLLNQFAANATGRTVITGPVEATAIGNVLMQMLALGFIGSLAEGRALVRRSFPVETYYPQDSDAWAEAYQRYQKL